MMSVTRSLIAVFGRTRWLLSAKPRYYLKMWKYHALRASNNTRN